jgi:hypothetical protein
VLNYCRIRVKDSHLCALSLIPYPLSTLNLFEPDAIRLNEEILDY